ncbi:hypothetical protein PC116_g4313 [Phytophthora cactorum]|nr:hypothetical protein PC113_g2183 [Phytophthora cactorum]KAG2942175.1 hypothetical protein PC115_g1552 [Phytophthora cactorum]KAG2952954.1 hypothetical protein PC117_g2377 [Phytophthora cactorum]KAG4247915.1 hypothetical protein PC116_g4313 [Phytophthora cactorum]
MLLNRGDRSGSTASALHSERRSSVEHDAKSHGAAVSLASNEQDGDLDEDVEEYDSDEDLVEKDGSLLAWVQEDPRHAIIGFLLVLIVYLASVMHHTRPPTIIDKAEP